MRTHGNTVSFDEHSDIEDPLDKKRRELKNIRGVKDIAKQGEAFLT